MSNNYNSFQKQSVKNHKFKIIIPAIIVLLVALGTTLYLIHNPKLHKTTSKNIKLTTQIKTSSNLSAVEAGLLPWRLTNPLSRMVVYPGTNPGQLVIAGGLTTSNTSSNGIFTLNVSNGALNQTGSLPKAVHDAAGVLINNQFALFGGGDANSYNNTTIFSQNGQISASSTLPQLRSDLSAIKVGNLSYVIGGYDGSQLSGSILTTTDGVHFTNIGSLIKPVRYAAVTSQNGLIYVFGGLSKINGSYQPTDYVQIINTVTHKISLANYHLPVPIEGASAFTLNNEVLVAGGLSNTTENIPLGVGTTQVPGINVNSNSLTQNTIWALNTNSGTFLKAGILQVPTANAGVAVSNNKAWIIGGEYNSQVIGVVQVVSLNPSFGIAGTKGAGSPYYGGSLMIADRGNNRILVMNTSKQIIWKYPSSTTPVNASKSFYFPDDAFFINHGTGIISNQENNNTIVEIGYPSGKIIWSFGHPLVSSPANGYLDAPDDAYLLKNGNISVADDQNCRVQFISPTGQVVGQIGTTGVCVHNPGHSLAYVNGDTPLFDGNILLSEIRGAWVDEYTPQGKLVWETQLPISYPSDPQQIGATPTSNPDHYLIADYANPGSFIQFTREGKILSEYKVNSGPGMLNHPSLVELLPSGVYMSNDDYRDRVVAIDPNTQALVWQYGVSDTPGTSTGMLYKPDGFDILMKNGTTPTHLMTK